MELFSDLSDKQGCQISAIRLPNFWFYPYFKYILAVNIIFVSLVFTHMSLGIVSTMVSIFRLVKQRGLPDTQKFGNLVAEIWQPCLSDKSENSPIRLVILENPGIEKNHISKSFSTKVMQKTLKM